MTSTAMALISHRTLKQEVMLVIVSVQTIETFTSQEIQASKLNLFRGVGMAQR